MEAYHQQSVTQEPQQVPSNPWTQQYTQGYGQIKLLAEHLGTKQQQQLSTNSTATSKSQHEAYTLYRKYNIPCSEPASLSKLTTLESMANMK